MKGDKTKALIHGLPHRCVVLLVTGRDEFGRPKTCEVVYQEESVHLAGGEEFVTAFVPAGVVQKAGN